MARLLLLLLLCLGTSVMAQDYEREARWRSEVLGNLVVGDGVQIALPGGRTFLGLHTPGKRAAVLLVHGLGVHPDHGLIGILRVAFADMGFTTLSIQMPVLAADAPGEAYQPLVPEAVARIVAGADWLRARGDRKVVLASHSLGSHFALETAKAGQGQFAAWICMGRGGDFGDAKGLRQPVLDVHGEKDNPAVIASAPARRAALEQIPGSRQAVIAGADHFYNGREEELARVLGEFLSGLSR